MESQYDRSLVIIPYLKTSAPFRLGRMDFRSTDDLADVPKLEAEAVTEIANMLYLQNSVRIKSGTYGTFPKLPEYRENDAPHLSVLRDIQATLAYCYAAPQPHSGANFLPLESSDILVMTPDRVTDFIVWPNHHTIDTEPEKQVPILGSPKTRMRVGYRGVRNFTASFCVVKGCRIYPSVPHLPLNLSQDLAQDTAQFTNSQSYGGLLELMDDPGSEFRSRIFTAIRWFNHTTALSTDEDRPSCSWR